MKSCVIIPARYKSSRFPGKPLVNLHAKPMILWVAELAAKAIGASNVYIATDDIRISNVIRDSKFQSILTGENLLTGTDRVAEACMKLDYEIFINVQGDEPMINPDDILKAIDYKIKYPKHIINSYTYLGKKENPLNTNIPKVITNESNELIYISNV